MCAAAKTISAFISRFIQSIKGIAVFAADPAISAFVKRVPRKRLKQWDEVLFKTEAERKRWIQHQSQPKQMGYCMLGGQRLYLLKE
ncbi:TPA: hypothetical protein MI603_07895 [Klebsiella pneumoniae]|nr:hypothetical protein AOD72_15660 [Klebsiella pneumoniae subsp. pneumoniae]ANE70774.1 hypothetical protein A7B01_14500 [Klebsiella pneumoniae]AMV57431.1 hypothetical protein AOG31_15345 [Klebsiella pneumoniae subsp. pneumoniae]AOR90426.1 hypothetical protein AOG30_15975 [Klebsiella pneumoniae subsp. pneumoniae]AOZ36030.1 hypothetical protein ACG94_02655 [Klebsiella pneumoniae]